MSNRTARQNIPAATVKSRSIPLENHKLGNPEYKEQKASFKGKNSNASDIECTVVQVSHLK